jgi:nitroimidazol reductase NimA-like FMN-containing flavoprotein (pyridoxamine 5'-phosphate oxidase superfamily)
MLGKLSEQQIDDFLKAQVTGRIGCYADGQSYIVPINYVYDGTCIYGHSAAGKKIEMMRQNAEVCFQVDQIDSIFRWTSVIAWGHFEEITDIAEKQQAMQRLIHRIMPLNTIPEGHPSHGITENAYDIGTAVDLIIYKIILHKKTGRFENH